MKRKKLLVGAIALTMAFTMPGVSVMAQDEQLEMEKYIELSTKYENEITDATGKYKYVINADGTAKLTGYVGATNGTNYVKAFPETVDGYAVTALGSYLYTNCNVSGLDIPAYITTIDEGAFAGVQDIDITISPENSNCTKSLRDGLPRLWCSFSFLSK